MLEAVQNVREVRERLARAEGNARQPGAHTTGGGYDAPEGGDGSVIWCGKWIE